MGVHYPKGWRQKIPLTIATLFALYRSAGDVTINSATSLPTTHDGPIQVARFGTLTVNAALTAANRCRGLLPLCDSLTMGAAGSFSMAGMCPASSRHWINQDILVPSYITLSGNKTSLQHFLQWIRETGYFICDPTLYACPPAGMGDVTADYAEWPGRGKAIVSAAGCGFGGAATLCGSGGQSGLVHGVANGNAGGAGTKAPGGGGSGGANAYASSGAGSYGGHGRRGWVWGGGTRGTGYANGMGVDGSLYGGDTPAPGGVLVILVANDITVAPGHVFSVDAVSDPTAGFGGPGAGRFALYRGGSLTGTINATAKGGTPGGSTNAAGAWGGPGGPGGAGETTSDTLASIGL